MFWTPILLGTMIYYQDSGVNKEEKSPSRNIKSVDETKNHTERIYSYKRPIIEKTEVSGSLTKKKIKNTLEKNTPRFKNCLDNKSKEKLKVEFEIDKTGSVPKKSIKSKSTPEAKCVALIIQEIKFPKPTKEERVKVKQTFGDPSVENEGYSGLQNHFCRTRVSNFLIYARIKILEALDENHYRAALQSLEKIICEYSNQFPIKKNGEFILKVEEKINPKENCAYLPLSRTWEVYHSKDLENTISLWVWKIAPKSFFIEKLYQAPNFYKCKQ